VLSDLFIRNVAAPEKGVKRYPDKDGLWLQVSQGGTKTFFFIHGPREARQYLKIGRYGPYPLLSLAKAREKVRSIIAKRTLGIEDETSKVTVQDAIDRFTAKHCDVHNKPRTAQETKRLLKYLAPISRRRIATVTTHDVLDIVDKSSEKIGERRHVFATSRTFLRWAARQRLIKVSPLHDLKPPGLVKSRDRLLTDKEMKAIYKAAIELGHPYGFICLIAIHTGMRRGEVGGLKWAYITPETITLPPALTKNNREHVLPNLIADELAAIPKAKLPDGSDCEYLFPSSVFTPYSTWSDGKEALDELCKIENFVFHDFRRYLSSTMAKLGVAIDVTEAILNHVTGSRSPIQRVYDRYDRLPEMRKALEVYEKHLSSIIGSQ
jgi:integrase